MHVVTIRETVESVTLYVNGTEYLSVPRERAEIVRRFASEIRDATHARGINLETATVGTE